MGKYIHFMACLLCSSYSQSYIIDPTKPYFLVEKNTNNNKKVHVNVQGVLKTKHQYKAFVDGQLVSVGDEVKGFEVKKINSYAVTLIKNGELTTIPIRTKVKINDQL